MADQLTRTVFYISDGTGITAEMLGHSLVAQFEGVHFRQARVPFIDSVEKAKECLEDIRAAAATDGGRPIIITTVVDPDVVAIFHDSEALLFDLFEQFIGPLEAELGVKSSHAVGRFHGVANNPDYMRRMEAVNFALTHDDGLADEDLEAADLILVGVSRSGKTPTCVYLALQFGVKAANYPLIPEDFDRMRLPESLYRHRQKLFGLSIQPERLHQIRQERRPGSRYAALDNCRYEVEQAQELMQREGIRWLDSTRKSVEEIAATVMHRARLNRQGF